MRRKNKKKPKHIDVFLDLMAEQGCIITATPAQIHHIRTFENTRNDLLTFPLSLYHHTSGPKGEAIHNGKFEFQGRYGSQWDLYAKSLDYVIEKLVNG